MHRKAGDAKGNHLEDTPLKVLIVDDTRTIRLQLRNILYKLHASIIEADSGAEALRIISESLPDLVLMDVVMPEMSGIECLRAIRANEAYAGIRVIMVTGASDYERIADSYHSGCNDYITKPINGDELIQKIEKVMRLYRIIQKTRSSLPAHFLNKQ